jgi:hypothetical protein
MVRLSVSSEVQEAMNSEAMAIVWTVALVCRNDWAVFMSLCRKSLTLQPCKMEVISLINSEFPQFLCFIYGTY